MPGRQSLNSEARLVFRAVPGGPGLFNKAVSQNKTKTTNKNEHLLAAFIFHAQHKGAQCRRVQCPILGLKSVTKHQRIRGLGPREHSNSEGLPSPASRSPSLPLHPAASNPAPAETPPRCRRQLLCLDWGRGYSGSSALGATAAACRGGRDGGRGWRGASARGWAPRGYAADRKPPGRAALGPSVICFFLFFSSLHDCRLALLLSGSRRDAPSRAAGPDRRRPREPGAAARPGRPPGPEAWAFGAALRRSLQPALGAPGPGPGPAEYRALWTTQSGPNRPPLARSPSELPPGHPRWALALFQPSAARWVGCV